jgi:PilZ domain
MTKKNYQRRYLRAPFKESIIYADGSDVLRAKCLNISENGLLISELPAFPDQDQVPLLIKLPQIPSLKNFSLLKMQNFNGELFPSHIIRVRGRIARRGELSQDLGNIFTTSFGLQFSKIGQNEQKMIEEYVTTFSSNLVFLQTLIDSYNGEEDIQEKTRVLAAILGYQRHEKIAQLRLKVNEDYRNLQWL